MLAFAVGFVHSQLDRPRRGTSLEAPVRADDAMARQERTDMNRTACAERIAALSSDAEGAGRSSGREILPIHIARRGASAIHSHGDCRR